MHARAAFLPTVLTIALATFATRAEKPNKEQHAIGARYDAGGRGNAIGAGYMYFHGIIGNDSLVAAGTDVKAYVGAFDEAHAAAMIGIARLTAGSSHGGCRCTTIELGLGPIVSPRGTSGVGHLGLYLSILTLVDVGYAYQFPVAVERAPWLSSHQFSARMQIPIGGVSLF